MENLACLICMGEERIGVRERQEVWEPIYFWTMIQKTFSNDSTIRNIRDLNFIGRQKKLPRRPSVDHLVYSQEISSKT